MNMTNEFGPGLINGVYSYREAGRLLGVAHQRVSRWADGYVYKLRHGTGKSDPILKSERNVGVLSFPELWELFFVREFVALGVPLPQIRSTAEALSKVVGPHPFSKSEIIVSGRELLVRHSDEIMKRPDIGQLVADFADGLVKHITIRDKEVGRYNIPEFEDIIYLDGKIRGGEPVATENAIPTRIIYGLWEKERDIMGVAEYFEITKSDVSFAIRYEGQWRLAA